MALRPASRASGIDGRARNSSCACLRLRYWSPKAFSKFVLGGSRLTMIVTGGVPVTTGRPSPAILFDHLVEWDILRRHTLNQHAPGGDAIGHFKRDCLIGVQLHGARIVKPP
jgi:hypothetical protein